MESVVYDATTVIECVHRAYQGFGLLLVFVIVELIPTQNKPATVPSLDKTPLLPEPPTPDNTRKNGPPGLFADMTSAALGTAVGRTAVVHYSGSNLQKQAKQFRYTEDCKYISSRQ